MPNRYERFHIVKAADLSKVSKYIRPCPPDKRAKGKAVRHITSHNMFVSNFTGSERIFKKEMRGLWELRTIEEGVQVANIRGLLL